MTGVRGTTRRVAAGMAGGDRFGTARSIIEGRGDKRVAACKVAMRCVAMLRHAMNEPRAATALVAVALCLAAGCGPSPPQPDPGPPDRAQQRHLLIVLDGLRPDYVTAELMPNLHALGERGVVFTDHHAVYPTVTRVNAASISTGAYPETHGLMGNAVFFPEVDATRFLSTSERDNLLRIERARSRAAADRRRRSANASRTPGCGCSWRAPARAGRRTCSITAWPAAASSTTSTPSRRRSARRFGSSAVRRRPPRCPAATAIATSSTRSSRSASTTSIRRWPSCG